MSDGTHTRRTVLKTSAAVAGLGAVAGCSEGSESDEPTTGDGTNSYSVSMAPVGSVEFDDTPQTWVANNGSWADMGAALGVEPPEGLYLTSRYHTQYYDEIPGISVDKSDMVSLWEGGLDLEQFLALGEESDVFVMDPNFIPNRSDNWDAGKIEQVREAGTPFFGNSIFSRGYEWHDYEYYTLYEAFEKLAAVFQREERYEAFADLHETFQSNVEAVRPPESDRPSVAVLWPQPANEPEQFSPYLVGDGTSFKQWRDLGVRDALARTNVRDFHENRGRIDYETLLDVDPDVLMIRGHEAKTAGEFEDTVVSFMENDDTASDLTAVQNGDVYRGGPLYQGPITNLVVTERAARQLYGAEGDLFERQRVADIVAGDV